MEDLLAEALEGIPAGIPLLGHHAELLLEIPRAQLEHGHLGLVGLAEAAHLPLVGGYHLLLLRLARCELHLERGPLLADFCLEGIEGLLRVVALPLERGDVV
jgi:hypothetical protein